jgi:hypothetical protein
VGSQTFFRAFRETCANRLKFQCLKLDIHQSRSKSTSLLNIRGIRAHSEERGSDQ